MFQNIFLRKNITLIVILISFLISVAISKYNLINYDKYNIASDGTEYHQMIKGDPYRYLADGYKIKEDLKNGKDFFSTGNNYTKYLPSRIAAAYYYFFDKDLFNNFLEKRINIGIHFSYLVIQNLFYFFSVLYLYFSLIKIFKKRICFFIVSFLCIEPTLNQYLGTFWHESYSFSFQIILISLILRNYHSYINLFFIGFFLGLLGAQKQYLIFYIIFVLIYFFITLNNKKFRNFFIIIFGFLLVQLFIGYNNKIRSGNFFILPSDTRLDLHRDLVEPVMSKKLHISQEEFKIEEGKIAYLWIKNNLIPYKKDKINKSKKTPEYMDYRESISSEADQLKFDNYIRSRTFDYIFKYPADFIKHGFVRSMHILLLNPFHVYSDHNFISGKHYYTTTVHDKLIPYRIFYSIFIYIICIFGLRTIIKEKNYNLLLFIFLSVFYFYLFVSWHGNTRYFAPVLIYLSFLFAFGIDKITSYKKFT
jgi:hypothetical protein